MFACFGIFKTLLLSPAQVVVVEVVGVVGVVGVVEFQEVQETCLCSVAGPLVFSLQGTARTLLPLTIFTISFVISYNLFILGFIVIILFYKFCYKFIRLFVR